MENVEMNMKHYYLLRSNRESGPYTLKELVEMPLLTTDLIWVNGESTSWKSPFEIEELQGLAKTPEQVRREKTPVAETTATVAPRQHPSPAATPDLQQHFAGEPVTPPSFEELSKKYESNNSRKRIRKNRVSIGSNVMGILILLIGISLSAFMLQKAVENIDQDTVVATAEAREIGEATTYLSTSSQAAMAPEMAVASVPVITSAAATETTVAPATETGVGQQNEETMATPPAPVKKKEAPVSESDKKKIKAEKEAIKEPAAEKENPATEEKTAAEEKAEKDSIAAAKNSEKEAAEESEKSGPKLRLSANEYKVGLFGGISNLELSVSNPSQQAISRAVVQVEYLKPNGKVVGTQKVEISGIAPNASKQVSVPDNGRGVSVRYRVVNVELK